MRWKFTLNPDTDNKVISDPIGWADIVFTLKRDKLWHGVFFEYSVPLKFYNDPNDSTRDAFDYLQALYQAEGVRSFVILKVELACNDTDAFTEEGQWRMNFTTYREERGVDCTVELNLEPENALMTFKNRYDQKVDLDTLLSFNGAVLPAYSKLPFDLSLPPVTIFQIATINSEQTGTVSHTPFLETDVILGGIGGTASHSVICYTNWATNPGFGDVVADDYTNLDEIAFRNVAPNELVPYSGIVPIYTVEYGGEYEIILTLSGRITITVATNANNTDCSGDENKFNYYKVEVWIEAGATSTLIYSDDNTDCFTSVVIASIPVASVSNTYSLNASDEIKIYVRIEATGEWNRPLLSKDVNWTIEFNGSLAMDVYAKTVSEPSQHPCYAINETGSRILEAISDDKLRLLSDYYGRTDSEPYEAPSGQDGKGSLRVVTTGLHIRDYDFSKFNQSFKEYFEGLNAIDNVGIGFENDTTRAGYQVVRLEDARYFYDSTVLFQLDKIPMVVIVANPDEHYSIVKLGYAKFSLEEFYGLDEFNTNREYRTELDEISNSLEKICQWIASGYAVEITRRNKVYLPSTKEDWRFDNDTFIICIKRGGSSTFEVEQGNITAETNLVDPTTVYNYRISPVRNAMRWLKTILQSYRDVTDADSTLIFTDGEGNVVASGLMTGDNIIEAAAVGENSNLSKDSLGNPGDAYPIFVPETWEFEFPLSLTQYNLAKANPTHTIQCRFGQDADYYDFYIREIAYRPNIGKANFKLLPKKLIPLDPCSIYILQARGTGSNVIGSALFVGAELSNLFVFVNGEFMKYNDANAANNEIVSFDATTGLITLNAPVTNGVQVSIFHLPETTCNSCIHRFEGRGSGSTTKTLTGYGSSTLAQMFCFYNGQLMKYNDLVAANNELVSYVGGTELLTFNGPTNVNRELRVIGFVNCGCIRTYSGRGDGTSSPTVSVSTGTLANIFAFYNGNLLKYNDSNPANNEITGYDSGVPEVTLNFTTNANREVRAFKLENC